MTHQNLSRHVSAAIAALILVYFLSPPFVFAALDKSGLEPDGHLMARLYAPVQWLYSHCTLYSEYIAAMNRFLGLGE